MTTLNDYDVDELVTLIASSDGDINLAAERFDKLTNNPYGTTKDYAIKARLSEFDIATADKLASKLRTLLIVELYALIVHAKVQLLSCMDELRPAELARTYTSLTSTFSTLTTPATKVTFDLDREIQDIAREFPDIPIEDIRGTIKEMEQKIKVVK